MRSPRGGGLAAGSDPASAPREQPGRRRARIRGAREEKPAHDARSAQGHVWERERGLGVEERPVLTVFLTGAECPFTCLFCDLWRHTLPGRTPAGALPAQLRRELATAGPAPPGAALKLYNASNFFDPRAVPPSDHTALAAACAPFERVTVESHPVFLGARAEAFRERLAPRLEVAIGLETVHPDVFPRLKDGMTLDDFERAAGWARERGIGVRAFVLVGLPWVPAAAFADWGARSALWALERGADRVSLIPLRGGSGTLARLARAGELEPVRLADLEGALATALREAPPGAVVEADLWDADDAAGCPECRAARLARLAEMNRAQLAAPPLACRCEEGRESA